MSSEQKRFVVQVTAITMLLFIGAWALLTSGVLALVFDPDEEVSPGTASSTALIDS